MKSSSKVLAAITAPEPLIQGSLFEIDYLRRSLGSIANIPDAALTELVANAWDAGASRVKITIPDKLNGKLIVDDDGVGLTPELFHERWMRLGYNRISRQGKWADAPPEQPELKRTAYGRNGIGRHGMLCFSDEYEVVTRQAGTSSKFVVKVSSDEEPFVCERHMAKKASGHGTLLTAKVIRNRPDPDRIRQLLTSRFLGDPNFHIFVNGERVELEELPLIDNRDFEVSGIKMSISAVDSSRKARTRLQHGIIFWIGGRRVGEPSWILGRSAVLDARSNLGRRLTIVVRSNDLLDKVLADWSGFKIDDTTEAIFQTIRTYAEEIIAKQLSEQIEDTKTSAIRDNVDAIRSLEPIQRHHITEFVHALALEKPTAQPEEMSTALRAFVRLEQSRTGKALLDKLLTLSDHDFEALDKLLEDWSVHDALIVLNEVDRRLKVVEALERLVQDKDTDELHTIHPLVLQSRWLFGPEYESAEYASNVTMRRVLKELFSKRFDSTLVENMAKRPDLVFLKDATVTAVATEDFTGADPLARLRRILLIELKRGQSTIGRDELNQGMGYVEDLINTGLLDGTPYIEAFIVGFRVDKKVSQPVRTVGENPKLGRVEATSFDTLMQTANRRLFRLKEKLKERYGNIEQGDLVAQVLAEPQQMKLQGTEHPARPTEYGVHNS